jgi:flagellar basal-body rod protein FlgB
MRAGIASLPLLKQRMAFLEARQTVLSENIANADTPGFTPRDIVPPGAGASLALTASDARHLGSDASASQMARRGAGRFETRPRGSAVSLEEEMLRIAEVQIEHNTLASLYQRSLASLKTAIGRKG